MPADDGDDVHDAIACDDDFDDAVSLMLLMMSMLMLVVPVLTRVFVLGLVGVVGRQRAWPTLMPFAPLPGCALRSNWVRNLIWFSLATSCPPFAGSKSVATVCDECRAQAGTSDGSGIEV
jgi:hypothetical protein